MEIDDDEEEEAIEKAQLLHHMRPIVPPDKDEFGKATVKSNDQKKIFKTKNGRLVYDAGGIDPDVFLPLFGGILLDTIGIRTGLVLFCAILTVGQFVFMMGGYQENYDELIAGRVIYGVGGESMGVA